jgi:AmiR/NasT family two-component response regulator
MEQSGSDAHVPAQTSAQEARDVVAQATGVLVAQFGIAPDDAFETLATVARDNDRRVVDLAREIVKIGGL